MKPSLALDPHRAAVREATARFRASNPRIFGPVVQGTDMEGSDLDLLVETLPGATLFDVIGLQIELAELLGVSVNVVTLGGLKGRFRDEILAEALPI